MILSTRCEVLINDKFGVGNDMSGTRSLPDRFFGKGSKGQAVDKV